MLSWQLNNSLLPKICRQSHSTHNCSWKQRQCSRNELLSTRFVDNPSPTLLSWKRTSVVQNFYRQTLMKDFVLETNICGSKFLQTAAYQTRCLGNKLQSIRTSVGNHSPDVLSWKLTSADQIKHFFSQETKLRINLISTGQILTKLITKGNRSV